MDLSTFTAALQSIKTATDIAKAIRESKKELEQAELNLKIAGLMGSLADAKIEMANVRDLLLEKENRIEELEEALKIKEELVRHGEAYYFTNDEDEATGDPLCANCWEANNDISHLASIQAGIRTCPRCESVFRTKFTPKIKN